MYKKFYSQNQFICGQKYEHRTQNPLCQSNPSHLFPLPSPLLDPRPDVELERPAVLGLVRGLPVYLGDRVRVHPVGITS